MTQFAIATDLNRCVGCLSCMVACKAVNNVPIGSYWNKVLRMGMLFKGQNLAFLVSLAFGIAASSNFPVLLLSMNWKGLTTRGALVGGLVGLVSAVVLVILSPAVWKSVLGNPAAIFPYDNPALFSMTTAFVVAMIVSRLDKSPRARAESEAFEDQFVRAQTGLGAAAASKH